MMRICLRCVTNNYLFEKKIKNYNTLILLVIRFRFNFNGTPQNKSVISAQIIDLYMAVFPNRGSSEPLCSEHRQGLLKDIKNLIGLHIDEKIGNHCPRALFYDIPRVGEQFYNISGSGRSIRHTRVMLVIQ